VLVPRLDDRREHSSTSRRGKVIWEVREELQPLPGKEFGIRSFVALRPPEGVIARLTEISRRWARRLGTQGVKWVSSTHFHLTLEFLGNVPLASLDELKIRLREGCQGTGALELGLSGAGCFPDFSRPKVLWIGVTGDTEGLARLAMRVAEATRGFGEPRDPRPFAAHLTMARFEWLSREQISHVKRIADRPEESDAGCWRADSLLLVRSELRPGGSVYETLDTVPLERA
jgi:2'-5' RNA ligase